MMEIFNRNNLLAVNVNAMILEKLEKKTSLIKIHRSLLKINTNSCKCCDFIDVWSMVALEPTRLYLDTTTERNLLGNMFLKEKKLLLLLGDGKILLKDKVSYSFCKKIYEVL